MMLYIKWSDLSACNLLLCHLLKNWSQRIVLLATFCPLSALKDAFIGYDVKNNYQPTADFGQADDPSKLTDSPLKR